MAERNITANNVTRTHDLGMTAKYSLGFCCWLKAAAHLKQLLHVHLLNNTLSQDVLVLPHKGDIGISQIQAGFLHGDEDDGNWGEQA